MAKIEVLLDRLKELDPETCHWPDYLIQGVIQDAIVARGWIFSLDRVDGHYTAYIWDERDRGLSADSCDSPAEALLRAYIAALEAVR